MDKTFLFSPGIPGENKKAIIKVEEGRGKSGLINGTYVYPLLIPHIASWISEDFAIKVSEIVKFHCKRISG